jgi:hypothetical protein
MTNFGLQEWGNTGRIIQVTADGNPRWGHSTTIDWATVAAVAGAPVNINDGFMVQIGMKYLRYGQVLCRIIASGKWGPYDPAAGDGRQLLVRSRVRILNESLVDNGTFPGYGPRPNNEVIGALVGGRLRIARIIQSGVAAASLAAGPTLANLEAALPLAEWTED